MPTDGLVLPPDHPFLRHGRWHAVIETDRGGHSARIVASIDRRQRTAAGLIGCLGFIAIAPDVTNGGSVTPAARRALAAATGWLAGQGAAVVRAPVQLSTWYGHRVVTAGFPDRGGHPPFPFEPAADHRLLALLEETGFARAHRAVSCLVDSRTVVAQSRAALTRADLGGLRDRPIRLDDLDAELALLRRLSTAIFRGTWGLSAIDDDEFATIYRPLARVVEPDLVRILETPDGVAVGFALGLGWSPGPDPGLSGPSTFVLKTIGVTEEARRRHPGLGAALAARIHLVALEHGYVAGIHALMARGSIAHRLSLRWGHEIRSYATFERRLP